jgi:iron-sulfur cluster repair protein YtfE (RIC family)
MSDYATSYTFMSLLEVHGQLEELFLQHQEALVALDIPRARALLERYRRALEVHMRDEDELLLPLYERAGAAPRGPVELFSGEHEKIRRQLTRFFSLLDELAQAVTPRGVVALITDQALFKGLMEHHDLRERELLYPTLDRAVESPDERATWLARLARERQ